MESFPQYENDGSERLSFSDIWRNINPQEVLGIDCFIPDVSLNNDENLITLKLTATEFTQMLSALYNGAEITYPDTFLQIIANFLKGVHCPPEFEDDVCQNYPPYASFIDYAPVNPFDDLYTVPDGYLLPPFGIVGKDGYAPDGYENGDVLVAISSIPFLGGWDDIIGANLPTIQIIVNGAGKISLKLLAVPLGGMAIITIDNPPDIFDIIAGVLSGSESIVDLNRDDVSIPPETQLEIDIPIEVTGAGLHTVYVVFFPVIDDSIVPLRFGGGFRGLELCDFAEVVVDMGINDIRYDCETNILEKQIAGEWYPVEEFSCLVNKLEDVETNAAEAHDIADEALDKANLAIAGLADTNDALATLQAQVDALPFIEDIRYFADEDSIQAKINDEWENKIDFGQSIILSVNPLINSRNVLDTGILYNESYRQDGSDWTRDSGISFPDNEARIADLETFQAGSLPTWSKEFDFTGGSALAWSTGAGHSAGNGQIINFTNFLLTYGNTITFFDQRIAWVELTLVWKSGGTAAKSGTANWTSGASETNHIQFPGQSDGSILNWMHVGAKLTSVVPEIKISTADALTDYYVSKMKFWGLGANPW